MSEENRKHVKTTIRLLREYRDRLETLPFLKGKTFKARCDAMIGEGKPVLKLIRQASQMHEHMKLDDREKLELELLLADAEAAYLVWTDKV